MRDLRELGLEQSSRVDEDMVERVYSKLGRHLPAAYIELVRFNEEPVPSVCVFDYPGGQTCVSEFFRFTDNDYEFGILQYLPATAGVPDNLQPIARDPGDWLVCINTNTGHGEVVLVEAVTGVTHVVAESFEKFIDSLYEG